MSPPIREIMATQTHLGHYSMIYRKVYNMPIFQHQLKIGLFLILITAAFLAVYSVWNHPGDAGSMPNPFPQQGYREGKHAFSHPPNQASKD